MGWRSIFTNAEPTSAPTQPPSREQDLVKREAGVPIEVPPTQLAGTTTHCAEAAQALFTSRRIPDGGMIEATGQLSREPSNPVDPQAVGVHVEGERIGYLPGHLAADLPLAVDEVSPCKVQLWGVAQPKGLRVIGWVAASQGAVTWPHTRANPPPMTSGEQSEAKATAISSMVEEALVGPDPARAAQFRAGMLQGYHYLETVEPIKQLKREGRLEEALELCYGAITAAEKAAALERSEPPPWYTEQAAIIHRKLGQRDEEIAVLQRWLSKCPKKYRAGSRIQARLSKLGVPNSD